TLVTISLAGSLFFSVSPTEAKGRVLLYLLLTIAPFAVVSPLLGPLIDRSVAGRRALIAASALARGVLCLLMAEHLSSLWLYPEAFAILVASKLYGVTRGTLVPEMARSDQFAEHGADLDHAGWPTARAGDAEGYAGFNAQLSLLGTLAGLLIGIVGAGVLKGLGAPSVLGVAVAVYLGAAVASFRLPRPAASVRQRFASLSQEERDRRTLNPFGDAEVSWGLTAAALMRFAVGFATFLMAFGLRRAHAALFWYGLVLALSAVGSLAGLGLVTRARTALSESTLLALSLLGVAIGSGVVSARPTFVAQAIFVGWLGLCAAVAQPSFDAITQRHVPMAAQGRTFALLAVRQQLLWVVGALIPVAVSLSFVVGDRALCVVAGVGAIVYRLGRRSSS
ncbi:MAG TPA: hypothetical protein VGS61_07825, partial [Acidimicrobiales bacterium]|nr:hypothetical protein [Acidimicrobiales bacterium]